MIDAPFRFVTLRSLPARRAAFRDRKLGVELTGDVRRNADCPCGSGRKFKQCCLVGVRHDRIVESMRPEPTE